jgi:hypothetical protein
MCSVPPHSSPFIFTAETSKMEMKKEMPRDTMGGARQDAFPSNTCQQLHRRKLDELHIEDSSKMENEVGG